ncbi:MAG TPA: MarR family transcriptional regulator [Solirubrobacterales bacterium]|jgi:DNA-binding MarR family transcriptional regulator
MEPVTAAKAEEALAETTPEIRATAAQLAAMLTHVFLHDQGEQLQAIEESGLTITQCKALLTLAGPGENAEPRQITEIAERLGLSLPAMSRAVDGLVRKRLVTRVEDEQDRRVRRVAITAKGERLGAKLVSLRLASLEAFVSTLTAAQRRKLDAALDSLLERDEIAATYADLKMATS